MRYLHSQARTDIELCIKCTNSFQVYGIERCLPRSLTQETCSVSSRIALPRLPRVEEGPHHRVAQIWGRADQLATLLPRFFGINKIFRELLFSCISTDGVVRPPAQVLSNQAWLQQGLGGLETLPDEIDLQHCKEMQQQCVVRDCPDGVLGMLWRCQEPKGSNVVSGG